MTSPLIVIAGTATEVGKTWFGTRYLAQARAAGLRVAARKPAQSFAPEDPQSTDAERLADCSGETAVEVCPPHRWYPLAMAPPMAADALGRPAIHLSDLLAELGWPAEADLRIVETAGGLLSPIAHDGDNTDLIRALAPDKVVLVADAGLGTINAVRLCMAALQEFSVTVFLNRFDSRNPLHTLNRQWLRKKYAIDAVADIASVQLQ